MLRFALFLVLAASAHAQLSTQQKLDDFRTVVSLFNKQYGPYEWKKLAFGADLLKASEWEERVRATRNDIEFFEVMVQWVAALQDSHSAYAVPSNFVARLGFRADFYGGRALVDELQVANLPVRAGDELISIDGVTVEQWLRHAEPFAPMANPDSRRRLALQWFSERPQNRYPRAAEVPAASRVVVRRGTDEPQEFTLTWIRTGTPLSTVGPIPDLYSKGPRRPAGEAAVEESAPEARPILLDAPWLAPVESLRWIEAPRMVRGAGQRAPYFALPANFQLRLGASQTDNLVSGTFEAQGRRIGYLRIPSMTPVGAILPGFLFQQDLDRTLALVEREMTFFEANTDGLMIDVMRNPGGLVSYSEELTRRVIPGRFRTLGFELRATLGWVNTFRNALTLARLQGAPAWATQQLEGTLRSVETAYGENRGRTGAIPIGISTGLDMTGVDGAYTKPLIVLVDGFSASGGDFFPAVIQDAGRGLIVGERTNGAGGNVASFAAGTMSEATVTVTQSLMNRAADVGTADLPAAPYVENIGVRPDRPLTFMTPENLTQNGRPFLDAAVGILVEHIRTASPYVPKP